MKRATMLVLAAVLAVASVVDLGASPVSISTVVHDRSQAQPLEVGLRATRVDGSGAALFRTILTDGTQTVEMPDGNWELSIQSQAFWSAPRIVSVSPGQNVVLDLWPAGVVRGTVVPEEKGVKVQELRLRFAPAPGHEGRSPEGETVCTLSDERWNCLVPIGKHDLRILSRGFAAEFRWEREVPQGQVVDLGRLVLRRGASLVGVVGVERGLRINLRDVIVEARPQSLTPGLQKRRYTATPNPRGFFQITGLPAGEYVVHAESKQLRSADRQARIVEDRNAELRSPLTLDSPRKAHFSIRPPLTSAESPWHLRLYREEAEGSRMEDIVAATAESDGTWTTELVPGKYLVRVGPFDGTSWRSAAFTIDNADVSVELTIPAQRVTGSVRLGDRSLAGVQVTFGGATGSARQTLLTDDTGHFAGEVPTPVDDMAKKWTITIEGQTPRVQRTAAYEATVTDDGTLQFDIDLPIAVIRGRVLDEDGSAARNAFVTLRSEHAGVVEQATTEEDGSFEIFGFDPGVYHLQADAFERSSEIMKVAATGTETLPVDLVLRREVRIQGRIQSRSAAGVEAVLTAVPRDVRATFVPESTTDVEGGFVLILPPRTGIFDLAVKAPGFALASGRVTVRHGKALTITVDQRGGTVDMIIPRNADVILRHDGAELPARWLATLSGGSVQPRDEKWEMARSANVEAGEYVLCAAGRCRTGFVTPDGTLLLSLEE